MNPFKRTVAVLVAVPVLVASKLPLPLLLRQLRGAGFNKFHNPRRNPRRRKLQLGATCQTLIGLFIVTTWKLTLKVWISCKTQDVSTPRQRLDRSRVGSMLVPELAGTWFEE